MSIKLCISISEDFFVSSKTVQTLMKYRLMRHFIWVFTLCQGTCLPVSRIKLVNCGMIYSGFSNNCTRHTVFKFMELVLFAF